LPLPSAVGLGTYNVRVQINDENGHQATSAAVLLTVTSTAPTLTLAGDSSVNEGNVYTLNLSASEPGSATISGWTVNWGDGPRRTFPATRPP
jgi:hypothetical protein